MGVPPRPDIQRPPPGLGLFAALRAGVSLPLQSRLQVALAISAPIAGWLLAGALVLRRSAPFASYWLYILLIGGLLLVAVPGAISRRRTIAGARPPGPVLIVMTTVVAFAAPQVAALFEPFNTPEPVPIPGSPTLYVAAAPYGPREIWLVRGGGDVRKGTVSLVAGLPGTEDVPSLSPDGTMLAFGSDAEGTYDLYVLPLTDGTAGTPRKVTDDPLGDEFEASWSPDGKWIAFTSRVGGDTDILLLRPDGTGLRPVTDDADSRDPSWSPDGRWITFSRPTDDDPDDYAIWTMTPSGGDEALLVDTPGQDFAATWFPDGTRFAFSSREGGDVDAWIGSRDEPAGNLTPDTTRSEEIVVGLGPREHILFISDRFPTAGAFLYFMSPDRSVIRLAAIA